MGCPVTVGESLMKKVLFIAHAFPPEGGPAVQRTASWAHFLPEFGWRPTVVTVSDVRDASPRDESWLAVLKEVRIERVAPTAPWLIRDKGLRWTLPLLRFVERLLRHETYQAAIVSGGPFFPFVVAAFICKRHGIPLVLDYRDPWVNNPYRRATTLKGKVVERLAILAERYAVTSANAVISVSPGLLRMVAPPRPGTVTEVIPNGYLEEEYHRAEPVALEPGRCHLVYVGSVGRPHYPLETLLEALKLERQRCPETPIRLHLVGTVDRAHQEKIATLALDDMVFQYGFRPHREALGFLKAAAGLVLVIPEMGGATQYDVSTKVYEYLRTGAPVLALVPTSGEAARLLRGAGVGLFPSDQSPEGVSAAMRLLSEGQAPAVAQTDFVRQFDRRVQVERLSKLLDGLSLRSQQNR